MFGWQLFSKRLQIDDEAKKAFTSYPKGVDGKNFSGGGAPRPTFFLLHFSKNPIIGG